MKGQQSDLVLAASAWASNADMVLDLRRLGYIKEKDHVLDPTYGRGLWWKKWKPKKLVAHTRKTEPEFDFCSLPYEDNTFDVVVFDPPYVSQGGRKTSTIKDRNDRFGLDDAPKTPQALAALIDKGIIECMRVLKPKGVLIIKCKDYISGGKLFDGTGRAKRTAIKAGSDYIDRLEHVSAPGPQPEHKRQVHARRNLSTCLVFRKKCPARRKK